jgi:hypothetical protein
MHSLLIQLLLELAEQAVQELEHRVQILYLALLHQRVAVVAETLQTALLVVQAVADGVLQVDLLLQEVLAIHHQPLLHKVTTADQVIVVETELAVAVAVLVK